MSDEVTTEGAGGEGAAGAGANGAGDAASAADVESYVGDLLGVPAAGAQAAPAAGGAADEGEEGTTEEPPAAAEEDAGDTEEKPKKKRTREDFESFLMSEAELAKPEGMKKAADYWKRERKRVDGMEIRTKAKAAALAAERTEHEADKRKLAVDQEQVEKDKKYGRSLLAAREIFETSQDMQEILDHVGRLCRRPGLEIFNRWARLAIKQNGGKLDESESVKVLQREIADLRRLLTERPREEEEQRSKRELDAGKAAEGARRKEVVAHVLKESEKYPTLAAHLALQAWHKPVLDQIIIFRREARAAGRTLDLNGALAKLEAELSARRPTGAKPAAKTATTAGSPVTEKVTSIAPSQTRSMSTVRDKTEDELAADLAADDAFLSGKLGLM